MADLRVRMQSKNYDVYKATRSAPAAPITTVLQDDGSLSSKSEDIHKQFRKKWGRVHSKHADTPMQKRRSNAIDAFQHLQKMLKDILVPTPFRFDPMTAADMWHHVQAMRASTGGLDGFLVDELKTLPPSFWDLRARIENLGEKTKN